MKVQTYQVQFDAYHSEDEWELWSGLFPEDAAADYVEHEVNTNGMSLHGSCVAVRVEDADGVVWSVDVELEYSVDFFARKAVRLDKVDTP